MANSHVSADPSKGEVFVFGSNAAGRHGKGAALTAMHQYGAKFGKGEGHHGASYAIPTKTMYLNTLPLNVIEQHVQKFLRYAMLHKHIKFVCTQIGCGLAGYKPEEIAPMFKGAPSNVILPPEFKKVLNG